MKTSTEQTVMISKLTEEQLEALLSGDLTWDEAYNLAPGPDLNIIEYETHDLPEVDDETR